VLSIHGVVAYVTLGTATTAVCVHLTTDLLLVLLHCNTEPDCERMCL